MTQGRDFKKVIRARMRKTGESYAAARAQLQRSAPQPPSTIRGGVRVYPFERFTEPAKKALTLAQQEAEGRRHAHIDVQHLLFGILRGEGLGAQTLTNLGVDADRVRQRLESPEGPVVDPSSITQIIPTARVKKVIEIAFAQAQEMGHRYVGTEHLLIGILVEGSTDTARTLTDLGATRETVRAEVTRLLAQRGTERAARPRRRELPMASELRALWVQAGGQAVAAGAPVVGLDHLLDVMTTEAGSRALRALLQLREVQGKKDEAIDAQDYEAAAEHRAAETRLREVYERDMAAWRSGLR